MYTQYEYYTVLNLKPTNPTNDIAPLILLDQGTILYCTFAPLLVGRVLSSRKQGRTIGRLLSSVRAAEVQYRTLGRGLSQPSMVSMFSFGALAAGSSGEMPGGRRGLQHAARNHQIGALYQHL